MQVYLDKEDMAVEANLKTNLYKLELIILKTLPFLLGLLGFISTIFDYIEINSVIVNYIMIFSLYSFIITSSYVFKFCLYHRLPIYYLILINILSIIDIYIGIPLSTFYLFQFYLFLSGIFLILIIYTYVKSNKKSSSKDNR
jgi:hypothetical protein